ncbi:MAG TPA: Xaa-Pro aminopeptidase, partial [Xanthomonadales bacterium]|nr:Xaa-Pro aminopeptidase [Xanthomonadales bacterium]
PAAPLRVRSHDTHHPFRQDSDFLYLSGFDEPDAVLVLVPGRRHGESLLFCRERDRERELWDGERLGPERAGEALAFDDAYPITDLDDILPGLLEGRRRVFYHFGRDVEFDLKLIGWVNRVRAEVRRGAEPPHEFQELGHLLHESRLFKSRQEIRLIRHAIAVSIEAHRAALAAVRPGAFEYQIEAALIAGFRSRDCVAAYQPIVGAGANGCVLHYVRNRARMESGSMLLVDAGAEYQGYAADITRTWPVGGRFSREQRALYEVVLAAQAAALAEARPGRPWDAGHAAAVASLTEGLLRLGLLKGTLEERLADSGYRRFYPHKTGHWLGLDVHDLGDYRIDGRFRELEPGMVFTVEPGLYVQPNDRSVPARWRGIGIRIEDDVLITRDGHELLSAGLLKDADAIEAAMAV